MFVFVFLYSLLAGVPDLTELQEEWQLGKDCVLAFFVGALDLTVEASKAD